MKKTSVGEYIRSARKRRGLSQVAVVERSRGKLRQPQISGLERGAREPTLGTLRRLAAAIGCSLSELLGE